MKTLKDVKETIIYDESSGRWRGRIPACIETDNKRKSFTGKSKKEVNDKLKLFHKEVKIGMPPQNEDLFKNYILKWLKNIKINQLKPTSYDRLESTINNHIIDELGLYKINKITPEIIQEEIINKMKDDDFSYSSVKKARDALNGCFSYAVKKGLLYNNPVSLVIMPRQEFFAEKEIRYFTKQEIDNFTNVCTAKYSDGKNRYKYGYAFLAMMNIGVRAGEMLALTWDSIKPGKGDNNYYIHVTGNMATVINRKVDNKDGNNKKYIQIEQNSAKTKSSTNRDIPLNKNAINYLNELKKYYISIYGKVPKYIIAKTIDEPLSIGKLQKSYYNILKNANIEKCGLHTLRHTFASSLFHNSVPIHIISKVLGHSSITITSKRYIHITNEIFAGDIELPNVI